MRSSDIQREGTVVGSAPEHVQSDGRADPLPSDPLPAPFYRRWIVANGWAEGLGLGTTLLLGVVAGKWVVSATEAWAIIAGAVAAVVLGALLEGVLVGLAQGRVLRTAISDFEVGRWVRATALGAGLAWMLGMVPSTVIGLLSTSTTESAAPAMSGGEPSAPVQYALGLLMGLVLGPLLAWPQVRVLRKYYRESGRWLLANAAAWALGMPLIFIGMDFVPWNGAWPQIALTVVCVCIVAGSVVGAVHGAFLRRMVPAGKTEAGTG